MEGSTPAKRKWIAPAIAGALLAIAGGIYVASQLGGGQKAPQHTYMSIKGEKITPQSLEGKVVLVNFWATSCVSCVKEMPDMVATYNRFKDRGFEFIAVAMNYDRPDYVVNFADARQLPFDVAMDLDGSAAKAFGDVQLTPTTFIISKDGKILKRYVGIPNFDEMNALIEKSISA